MRRLIRLLGLAVAVVLASVAVVLLWTHAQIRLAGGPLPSVEEIRALPVPGDAPIELFAVDTATQAMPRELVLDPSRDPTPDAPYRMSHPAFVLRWRDGRSLLVDLGMDPEEARSFGAPAEWVGADPIATHGAAADLLAPWIADAPLGVLFSHLHHDHVQGVVALCGGRAADDVTLFQRSAQLGLGNYTTLPGKRLRDGATCLRAVTLEDEVLAPVPGYPGVHVLYAAGHTPGSQVVIARLRDQGRTRTVVLTGDVVNNVDGIRHDVPKPFLYRLLVTPESDARLGAVRRLIAALEIELAAEIAVAHDRFQLEALGLLAPSSASARWPSQLRIRGGEDGAARVARDALERILATEVGARTREVLASAALRAPVTVVIDGAGDNLTWYREPGRVPGETIRFDPSALPIVETEEGPRSATPETVLAHEIGHAVFKLVTEDAVIVEVENPLRAELGLPLRSVF